MSVHEAREALICAAQEYAKPYTEGTPNEGDAFNALSKAIDDLIRAVDSHVRDDIAFADPGETDR